MAGNVSVTLEYPGRLYVIGDNSGNGIEIKNTDPSAGIFQIRGFTQDGANTLVNGSSLITYARGVRDIIVNAWGGNDYVWVGSSNFAAPFRLDGEVSVSGGDGKDTIVVQGASLTDLTIDTGNGADSTYVYHTSVDDTLWITGGLDQAGDYIAIFGNTNAHYIGVFGTHGSDRLYIDHLSADYLYASMYRGNDFVTIKNSDIFQECGIDGGDGTDTYNLVNNYVKPINTRNFERFMRDQRY